jgi:hypothetical protein
MSESAASRRPRDPFSVEEREKVRIALSEAAKRANAKSAETNNERNLNKKPKR